MRLEHMRHGVLHPRLYIRQHLSNQKSLTVRQSPFPYAEALTIVT